jgi:hypothetical protein
MNIHPTPNISPILYKLSCIIYMNIHPTSSLVTGLWMEPY